MQSSPDHGDYQGVDRRQKRGCCVGHVMVPTAIGLVGFFCFRCGPVPRRLAVRPRPKQPETATTTKHPTYIVYPGEVFKDD